MGSRAGERRTSRHLLAAAALALAGLALFASLASASAPGELDPSFGTEGKFVNPIGEGPRPGARVHALALQPDGKIVIAGVASGSKAMVARLTSDGSLDPSFGNGGRFLDNLGATGTEFPYPLAMVLQPDGKVVLGGAMSGRFHLARVNADGSGLDSSFGTGGLVLTQLGEGTNPFSSVSGLAVQPDGKILAAGGARDATSHAAVLLARLNGDGTFDHSFGGAAGHLKVQLGIGSSPSSGAQAILIQPDGKVLLGGFATDTNETQANAVMLARFGAGDDGFDASFGTLGSVVTRLGQTSPVQMHFNAFALQPDGKIVVGGITYDAQSRREIFVSRLNTDGSIDSTFGSGGTVITQFRQENISQPGINAIAVQPDGKIVAVGFADTRVLVFRMRPDGTYDSSFATGGKLITQLGIASSYFTSLGLQPDGKLVAGGAVLDPIPDEHALVARVLLDLPPAASFTAAPNPVLAGQPVAFGDTGSTDPDGTIVSYSWDFGDGSTAIGPSTTHTYSSPGAYTVTLTVRDDYGLNTASSQTVTVNPVAVAESPTGTQPTAQIAVLTRLSIKPAAFAVAARAFALARPTGAVITYRDTLAATTTFTVARVLPGRKSGKRCVKLTKANRLGKRCTRFVGVRGTFTHADSVGANRVPFSGRMRGRALALGSYRLSSTPRAQGKAGRTVTTRFRIVR